MLINLSEEDRRKRSEICNILGVEEILGQVSEECSELVQAAQKVRRARKGTTPVSLDDALVRLAEECADVCVTIDCLVELGLVIPTGIQFIGRYKLDRWYERTLESICRGGKNA